MDWNKYKIMNKVKKQKKPRVNSLNDLPEPQRSLMVEYYQHMARAMMLCQSAVHSLDEVEGNIFHRQELKKVCNMFIKSVESFANTFVETGNEVMVQTYSNIVSSIDEYKEGIKVNIVTENESK